LVIKTRRQENFVAASQKTQERTNIDAPKMLVLLLLLSFGLCTCALPKNKTVIKIGFIDYFSSPDSMNSQNTNLTTVTAFLKGSSAATEQLNTLLWLANRTNSNPNILPDTMIEIIAIDAKMDDLASFQAAVNLIKKENITAIIGDDHDESTISIALTASANNVLHCTSYSTNPVLSDKKTYPMTFRTQAIATCTS
jgi:ABC-type branched-subunit amino acid transport system substrate-binding protein